jgi:peptide/nickel transport system substrate-binding protein
MAGSRNKVNKVVTFLVALGVLGSAIAGCAPAATPTSGAPGEATATTAPEPTTPIAEEPTPTEAGPPVGGELIVGLDFEPSIIDPHRAIASPPTMQVCESLLMRKPDGTFEPGLATSWEISDDGTSYTFYLREGVEFHDGTPFNAEAVKYNFDRIVDPATESREAVDLLGPYLETEVVDDYTVVVHLETPFANFLDGMSSPWVCIVSPTAAEEWGLEEFQDHFTGTGPFVFVEWKRHEYVKVERNTNYWGGEELVEHQGLAYLDTVVFKFIEEAGVRSGTLETGEIQIAEEVPAVDVARLDAREDIDVLINPGAGTGVMLLLNMSKPPTDDLKVRQAIEYAVDQKAISDILYQGVLGPSYGPLSPVSPCYWSGVEDMYPYDPERARDLLEEAGWVDADGDGIRDKDGQPLRLDLPSPGDIPLYSDPCPIVQAQLAEVGIDVNLMNVAIPAWLEAGSTGELHIGVVDWRAGTPDTNLRLPFHSANAAAFAWNWHSNSHLDDLLEEGMVTTDPETACAIYEEVQQIIMDDAMIKPLHLYSAVRGVRSEVKGLRIDGLDPGSFWVFDVYLEQ